MSPDRLPGYLRPIARNFFYLKVLADKLVYKTVVLKSGVIKHRAYRFFIANPPD
jgi:hypothetical protein